MSMKIQLPRRDGLSSETQPATTRDMTARTQVA
jgi:hypothetical protein